MKINFNQSRQVFNNGSATTIIFFIVILLTASCKKSTEDTLIPNVPVNFTIQLSLPSYVNLNSPGGSVEIPSVGYKGVVVYRNGIDSFTAFDMACSFDPLDNSAILHVDGSGITMVDNHCGSKFSLAGNGSVSSGPATRPMKQYNALYDAGSNTVVVYN